jgi:hypothetical protein
VSRAQRNSAVLVLAAVLYYAWWRIANAYALARPGAEDIIDPLVFHALLDVVLGFALYFLFLGPAALRVTLAAAAPIVAGILLEITVGSDRAYPFSILLMASLIGFVFFVGSLMAAALHAWHKKRRQSVA